MPLIPVMAFKNKSKENRFLALSIDHGDFNDPELDVSLDNVEDAFLIYREDLTKPTDKDLDNVKAESEAHKKYLLDKFGENAFSSFDVEEWLKHYDPVHLEITQEQFEMAKDNLE